MPFFVFYSLYFVSFHEKTASVYTIILFFQVKLAKDLIVIMADKQSKRMHTTSLSLNKPFISFATPRYHVKERVEIIKFHQKYSSIEYFFGIFNLGSEIS